MGIFRKNEDDGRCTRHNRPLGDGLHCRHCDRLMHRDSRGFIICILCDRPNVALGIKAPEK